LPPRLLDRRRAIDAEHGARPLLRGEPGDHARLRRPRDRADDDRVEEDLELAFLLGDLLGPAREAEPAERMIRRAGRDRVRLPAACLDRCERVLPALAA